MSEDEDLECLGIRPGAVLLSPKTRFALIKLLGEGGFGAVYLVQDLLSREKERPTFAIKVEKKLDNRRHSKLKMEIAILKAVNDIKTGKVPSNMNPQNVDKYLQHFTEIVDRAKKDRYFFLVMQLVGKSLGDLKLERKEKVLSLGTGLSVSYQCLEAVECLHLVGYLHRDLKPANYACGLGSQSHVIYILDFGIARCYKKNHEGQLELKTPRSVVLFKGTVKFASMACHKNLEMGPHDDCESWFYLLLDLICPKGLPWKKESDKGVVLKIKETCKANPSLMCGNLICEEQLINIYNYIIKQEYFDLLDYKFLYQMLEEGSKKCNRSISAPYEWELNALDKKPKS